MKINAVFVFYTLSISLTQKSKKKYNTNCIKLFTALVKYALNRDTKINPFIPKTDHNLNSPHKINAPTNMVSIRIRENLNWRIIFH